MPITLTDQGSGVYWLHNAIDAGLGLSKAFNVALTPGSTAIAAVVTYGSTGTGPTNGVTLGGSAMTFIPGASIGSAALANSLSLFYKVNTLSTAATVQIPNDASASRYALFIAEAKNLHASAPLESTAENDVESGGNIVFSPGGTPQTLAIGTTSLVVAMAQYYPYAAVDPPTGFTEAFEGATIDTFGFGYPIALAYKLDATGTQSLAWNNSAEAKSVWQAVAASFKELPSVALVKKLKLLVHPSAASVTGADGAVFAVPLAGKITGTKLGEFSGQAFEATLESGGQAVLKVPITGFGSPSVSVGDTPVAIVRTTTNTTGMIPGLIIEE